MEWERDTSFSCLQSNGSVHVQGTPARFDINGLERGNRYTVTVVRAVNAAVSSDPSNTVTAMTERKGEITFVSFLLLPPYIAPSGPPVSVTCGSVKRARPIITVIHCSGVIAYVKPTKTNFSRMRTTNVYVMYRARVTASNGT